MTGTKPTLKLAAGVALIFCVGALTGILGASLYFEEKIEKILHSRPPRGERIVERLTQDLDLTPAQQEEIRPIVMAFDKKASDLKLQYRPQIKELHEQVKVQIRTRLDEKQKIKFDEINEKLEKRFRERPPLHPPDDGPREGPPRG
ncbi:MAG: hypothetical protein R6X27_17050 [Candidatus Desulfacyla sp.]